jgi:hypothetical protein
MHVSKRNILTYSIQYSLRSRKAVSCGADVTCVNHHQMISYCIVSNDAARREEINRPGGAYVEGKERRGSSLQRDKLNRAPRGKIGRITYHAAQRLTIDNG